MSDINKLKQVSSLETNPDNILLNPETIETLQSDTINTFNAVLHNFNILKDIYTKRQRGYIQNTMPEFDTSDNIDDKIVENSINIIWFQTEQV